MNYLNKVGNFFKKDDQNGTSGTSGTSGQKNNQEQEKNTIKYLNKIRNTAVLQHPTKELKNWKELYSGQRFSGKHDNDDLRSRNENYMNIIQPIIDTKVTAVLDAKIQTEVTPKNMSFSDIRQIKDIDAIADILQNCVENVQYLNKYDTLIPSILLDYYKYSIGIMKIGWDQSEQDFLGDIANIRISPFDFFPDPYSNSLKSSNYIFIRRKESLFSLKKRYQNDPDILNKIEKMRKEPFPIDYSAPTVSKEDATSVKNLQGDNNAVQAYGTKDQVEDQPGRIQMTESAEIWECYLKDDSIWLKDMDDNEKEKETKKKEGSIYPNGRVIIYSRNVILEDKPIDYPFGFPFECFQSNESSTFFGKSDIFPLALIQERLNKTYRKLSVLISKYVSKIFLDIAKTNLTPDNFNKADIQAYKSSPDNNALLHFSNKNLEQIQYLLTIIDVLQRDALKIARLNDTMISGERAVGVNSGKMVEKLLESPMSSIREVQRTLKSFLISVTQKNVTLVQLYYNQSRIVRYSSGNKFAIITAGDNQDENQPSQIEIIEADFAKREEREQQTSIQTIKGDLSLGKYEIRVTAGSEMAYSKQSLADQTIELVKEDVFGDLKDPNNLEVRELLLDALDYPNRRAIMTRMKAYKKLNEELSSRPPTFMQLIEEKKISLKEVASIIEELPNEKIKMEFYEKVGIEIGLIPRPTDTFVSDEMQ